MVDDKADWQQEPLSSPLSEFDVRRFVARAFPMHALASYAPVDGGLSNSMYRLTLSGLNDVLVLRLYSRDPDACQKEIDIHRLIAGRVPVPEVVCADPIGEDGVPYAVLRWINGMTFREFKKGSSQKELAEAAWSIGATLARLGDFQFDRPGPILAGLDIGPPFAEGNGDPVAVFIEKCLSAPHSQRRLGPEPSDRVLGFIRQCEPRLAAAAGERSLVHSDFGSPNILINCVNGRSVVVGILDWEFAFSGSPLCDIGHMLRYERRNRPLLEPHFSSGFRGHGGRLPEDWRQISRALDLMALCEFLTRPKLPEAIVPEIVELIMATVEHRDPK